MPEAIPFRALLGQRIRERRLELGKTQDELARHTWHVGLRFTRSVIDAVERGTRDLSVPETILLLAVAGLKLEDLATTQQVALDEDTSVGADELLGLASGARHTLSLAHAGASLTVNPATGAVSTRGPRSALASLVRAYSDAEVKAARRLAVDPQVIAEASEKLWGRPLDEERDTRVQTQAEPDATARTVQALRGHVTRALLEELRATLGQDVAA
jgi:transcriptional regulator with XRE-family HTH domain